MLDRKSNSRSDRQSRNVSFSLAAGGLYPMVQVRDEHNM